MTICTKIPLLLAAIPAAIRKRAKSNYSNLSPFDGSERTLVSCTSSGGSGKVAAAFRCFSDTTNQSDEMAFLSLLCCMSCSMCL